MKNQNSFTRFYFILLIVFLSGFNSFSQAPDIEWFVPYYTGSGGESSTISADGGYILAASTYYNEEGVNVGQSDGWVAKLDIDGNIVWQNNIGGSIDDRFTSIKATSDGGYILAGYTLSTDGDVSENQGAYDYWVVKINNTGTIEWQKTLGGSLTDEAYSITLADDGGYVVTGTTLSSDGDITGGYAVSWDIWVVKLDNTGNVEWQKILGGSGFEYAYSILTDNDGGYVLAGQSTSGDGDLTSSSLGGFDAWVVKINNLGEIQWQQTFGGSNDDALTSVIPATGGGYILAGNTASVELNGSGNEGDVDFWVVKIDGSGNLEWQETYGGTMPDAAASITATSDGGYAVCGFAISSNGDVMEPNVENFPRYWVIKLNNTGNLVWQKTMVYGGKAHTIIEIGEGQYIVIGSGFNVQNATIVKLAPGCTDCPIPTGLLSSVSGTTEATVTWDDNLCANAYNVRYKIKNAIGGWNSVSVNTNMADLSGLNPATTYLWRVRAVCNEVGLGKSAWSVTKKFKTAIPKLLLQLNENEGHSEQHLQPELINETLQLYPNPALNTINIQVIYPGEYQLLNSAGNLLRKWHLEAGLIEISLEKLGSGVYMVQMPDGRVQKFVKL